jgi:hypothetical protein
MKNRSDIIKLYNYNGLDFMYGNYFSSYKIIDNFGTPYEAS